MCGKSAQCRLDGAIGPSKGSARKERAFGCRPDLALRRPVRSGAGLEFAAGLAGCGKRIAAVTGLGQGVRSKTDPDFFGQDLDD